MENAKKQLKTTSIVILVFALLAVIRTVVSIVVGVEIPEDFNLPEGITAEFVKIVMMVVQGLALVFVIPSLYVGIKGYKVSQNPDGSKAHIVWAIILLVLSVLSLISGISDIISAGDIFNSIINLVLYGCDVAIYYLYVKYAKQIRNAQIG